jgi:hypothetical protein
MRYRSIAHSAMRKSSEFMRSAEQSMSHELP